jgi:hypothetical protein
MNIKGYEILAHAQKSWLSVAPPSASALHSQFCDTFQRLQPALLRHILKFFVPMGHLDRP